MFAERQPRAIGPCEQPVPRMNTDLAREWYMHMVIKGLQPVAIVEHSRQVSALAALGGKTALQKARVWLKTGSRM